MAEKPSSLYRTNEAREREYAAEAPYPHIQAMHERAASKWCDLAARAERIEGSKSKP